MLLIKQKNWQKEEHIHRKYSLYKKFIFLSLKSDIKVEQKEASIEESLLNQCDFSFQSIIDTMNFWPKREQELANKNLFNYRTVQLEHTTN
jgi:hypothetical protein